MPTMLAYPLLDTLGVESPEALQLGKLQTWFEKNAILGSCPVTRLFNVVRKEGSSCITQNDLKSMMVGLLRSHPGLEFLQETPEFQDR